MPNGVCDLHRARERKKHLKTLFDQVAGKKTHKINKKQLTEILNKLGDPMTEPECGKVFKEADHDKDGLVSFEDLMSSTVLMELMDPFAQEIEQLFKTMDTDNDGLITLNETKQAFGKVTKDIDAKHIEEIFHSLDTDHDGKINLEQFIQIII